MTRTRIWLAILAVVLAILGFSRLGGHEESPAVEERTAGATEEAGRDATANGSVLSSEGDPVGSGGALGSAPSSSSQGRTQRTEKKAAGTGPGSGGAASVRAGDVICDPLITDPKGDVDNTAIDILEASMTYDASRNTLVVHEVFDDIPTTPPFPNESLGYLFFFTLDGMEYDAHAYIGAAHSGEWEFSVHRGDRTGPNVHARTVMQATGRVDTQDDTVTIEIDVDEFNRGERRASDEEGLPPAAELRRGSTLTNVHLFSYPSSAAPTTRDEAYGCQYVVPES